MDNIVISNATLDDIDAVKKIADAHKKEIGFVLRPALIASAQRGELLIARTNDTIIGFLHWHHRKDGWNTMYEMVVVKDFRKQNVGRMLIENVPIPRRGKCPVDNESNQFHKMTGGILIRQEKGKRRKLNVYEWTK